ncbi:MAG: hypothetical protein ACYDCK_03740, partial [Thermoplasmatota archaeon]
MPSARKFTAIVVGIALVTLAFGVLPVFVAGRVAAAAPPPAVSAPPIPPPGLPIPEVGETWIVGPTTIDHQTLSLTTRMRVLPGAHLTITASSLTFASDPTSATGLIAEPGSIVDIAGSTFAAANPAATGTYTIDLQGQTTISSTTFSDPFEVVVSPRPATDQIAELAPATLDKAIDDEALLAADLAPGALLSQITVDHARGVGLVLAPAPVGDRVPLEKIFGAAAQGNVFVNDTTVTSGANFGALCYSTRENPSLDAGEILVSVPPGLPHLELNRDTFNGNALGGLVCPSNPTARTLPPRLVPVAGTPAPASLAQSPAPRAVPMTGVVKVTDTAVNGGASGGIGFFAPASLAVTRGSVANVPIGLDLASTKTTLTNVAVSNVANGAHVVGADLTSTGSTFAGTGTGIAVSSNTTLLSGGSISGFAQGLLATGGTASATGTTFANDATGALANGGALTLSSATLTAPRIGVQVAAGSATVNGATMTLVSNAQGLVASGGALVASGGSITGDGTGVAVSVAGGSATVSGLAVHAVATGVFASSRLTLSGATIDGTPSGIVESGVNGGSVASTQITGAASGITLDRSTGVSLTSNTFTDNGDPLVVLTTPTPTKTDFAHTVTGNTVNGLALSYVYNTGTTSVTATVGDLIVAYSNNVTYTDIDLAHGQWHVIASQDIVLGAKMTKTDALLNRTDAGATPLFDRVWHGVRFEQYQGTLHGPQGTLDQNRGNDLDQAMALASILHDHGRNSRFVDGQFTLTEAAYLNWTAMDLAGAGYAFGMFGFNGTWFGATARMAHTWLESQVAPGVWVTLDPSYDQYSYHAPLDLTKIPGVNTSAVFSAATSGLSYDYTTHSATNINWTAAVAAENATESAIRAYIRANPSLTNADFAGHVDVRPIAASEEPTSRVALSRYTEIHSNRAWSVRIRTSDGFTNPANELDWSAPTLDAYGKKIVVQSVPSSVADANTIVAQGGLFSTERSQVAMTTELWVNDSLQATDGVIPQPNGTFYSPPGAQRPIVRHPGDPVNLVIDVIQPGGALFDEKQSTIRVGGTYAVALEIGRVSGPLLERVGGELNASMQRLASLPTTSPVAQHDLMGTMFEYHGLQYFHQIRTNADLTAKKTGAVVVPLVSVAVTGSAMDPITKFNATRGVYVNSVYNTPPYIDVEQVEIAYPKDGDLKETSHYRWASGQFASNMEDKIFADAYALPSVSTIKILNVAAATGVRLYHMNASEEAAVLPHLSALPSTVLQSIENAAANGRDVIVPEHQVTYLNWTGVGWIEVDPASGAAAWLIYGGAAPPTNANVVSPA